MKGLTFYYIIALSFCVVWPIKSYIFSSGVRSSSPSSLSSQSPRSPLPDTLQIHALPPSSSSHLSHAQPHLPHLLPSPIVFDPQDPTLKLQLSPLKLSNFGPFFLLVPPPVMSTIVYQGLQSCLESQVMEPMSIRLKLTSPSPPHFSQFLDVPSKSSLLGQSNKGSEVQNETPRMASNSLANPISPVNKQDFAYVPPMTKSPSISLLQKSLEMCTEDLGNETGIVDHVSENMVSPCVPTDRSRSHRNPRKPREHVGAKERTRRSFPPPLTTISGAKSLQVRPHREDGRLVIEAVKTPSSYPHFQAERRDGRLRLCFLREPTSSCVDSIDDEGRMFDDSGMEDDEKDWEENGVFEEEEVDGNDMRDDACGDVNGILQRTGRCKEREPENRRLLTWEPSWVATS